MNKKDDKIKLLLNEYKEKIRTLEEKQRTLDEKQNNINKKFESQNKKNKTTNLIIIFLFIFVSCVVSAATYTYAANNVAYTPTDSSWGVANAQEAIDNLYDSVGSALVGAIYSYMGNTAPHGYLACDGSIYRISDYSRLAGHINAQFGSYNFFGGDGTTTFAVPDLRGEFLRGTGTNTHTNQGSGASVGTHQDATNNPNYYDLASNHSVIQFPRTASTTTNADTYINSNPGHANVNIAASGTNNGNLGSVYYTSRPTNTSVLYII